MADGTPMKPGFYNMDCMEAMKRFPDNFFDLAIVDPPYGDGNSKIGGGCDSEDGSIDTKRWNRFGQRFDKYKSVDRTGGSWSKKYGKKLLRGMLPRNKPILMSCSASHAIKSYGAVTISHSRRQGAF
jgi:DNA modification methylase